MCIGSMKCCFLYFSFLSFFLALFFEARRLELGGRIEPLMDHAGNSFGNLEGKEVTAVDNERGTQRGNAGKSCDGLRGSKRE